MIEPSKAEVTEGDQAKLEAVFAHINFGPKSVMKDDMCNNNAESEEIYGLDKDGRIIVEGWVNHEALPFCAPEDVKEKGANDEIFVSKWRHRAQLIFADVCELNLIYKMKMGERLLREVGPLVETLDVGKVKCLDKFDTVEDMDKMKFYHLPGTDMRDIFFSNLGESPSDELLQAIFNLESKSAHFTDLLQVKFEFEKGVTDPRAIPAWFFFPWLKRAFKVNVECEISKDASLAENLIEIVNDLLWFFIHHFLDLSLTKLRMMVPEDDGNNGENARKDESNDDGANVSK